MDDADVLTTAQIESLFATDTARLEQTGRDLAAAQFAYARATDPGNYFTPEAAQAALKEHLPGLESAEAAALRAATIASANARLVLSQTRSAGVTLASPAEYVEAEARRAFVSEDAASRPLAEIRDMVSQAIAVGDRPAMWLWHRYATSRVCTEDPSRDGLPGAGQAREAVRRMLHQIADQLRDRSMDPVKQRADAVLERAMASEKAAGQRRREIEQQRGRAERGVVAWPD